VPITLEVFSTCHVALRATSAPLPSPRPQYFWRSDAARGICVVSQFFPTRLLRSDAGFCHSPRPSSPNSFSIPTLPTNSSALNQISFNHKSLCPRAKSLWRDLTELNFSTSEVVLQLSPAAERALACVCILSLRHLQSKPIRVLDISSALAQNGATVYIVGRRKEKLEMVVKMQENVFPVMMEELT
jgi:hypothetical protein